MWTKKIICYIQTFLLTVHFCCICVYFSACFYHEAQTLSPCVCVSVCLRVRVSVCACVLDNRKCCCLHTHNTQHKAAAHNTNVFTATASRRGCGDPPPFPHRAEYLPLPPHTPCIVPLLYPNTCHCTKCKVFTVFFICFFSYFFLSFSIIFIYIHMCIYVYMC